MSVEWIIVIVAGLVVGLILLNRWMDRTSFRDDWPPSSVSAIEIGEVADMEPTQSQARPAVVDQSHRITLPKEVRQALAVEPGDFVGFRFEGKRVIMARARSVLEE